jgi:hypothetical protein
LDKDIPTSTEVYRELADQVSRNTADLEQMRRDIAQLARAVELVSALALPGTQLASLETDAPEESVAAAKSAHEDIAGFVHDVIQRSEEGRP